MYVNWPDGQLGAVNAANANQDLIAVRFFSTAASYNIGDFVVNGGQLYRATQAVAAGAFNPAQWTQVGGSVSVGDASPTNPQPGALWWDSGGGQLYVYFNDGNSSQWVAATTLAGSNDAPSDGTLYGRENGAWARALPLAGGSMTGLLLLSADPTSPLGASTKEYVDNSAAPLWQNIRYRNRIINGDMSVDQRHAGTAIPVSGNVYIIDRWKAGSPSITAPGHAGQSATALVPGFQFQLGWQTSTAYTLVAADGFYFFQTIEGYNFNDAQWGMASAQPVVLEFWAYSSLVGTFTGSLRNGAATRSYAFTFSLPTANTWTKVRLNIPGDTTGTWSVAGNAAALYLSLAFGIGTSLQTAANAWTAGNFVGAPGAVSVVGTLNATFAITGVALMVGAAAANAEPEFKKYSDNLLDCQRYYEKSYDQGVVAGTGSGTNQQNGMVYGLYFVSTASASAVPLQASFKVTKRAQPTMTYYSPYSGAAGHARDMANNADVAMNPIAIGDGGWAGYASSSVAVNQQQMSVSWVADTDF